MTLTRKLYAITATFLFTYLQISLKIAVYCYYFLYSYLTQIFSYLRSLHCFLTFIVMTTLSYILLNSLNTTFSKLLLFILSISNSNVFLLNSPTSFLNYFPRSWCHLCLELCCIISYIPKDYCCPNIAPFHYMNRFVFVFSLLYCYYEPNYSTFVVGAVFKHPVISNNQIKQTS